MAVENRPDPWRLAWQFLTSDGVFSVLLVLTGLGLTLSTWISQAPQEDPVAYARWMVQARADFGRAVPFLRTLGLFGLTRSLAMRVLFALLGVCLSLRVIEGIDRLRRRRRSGEPGEDAWRPVDGGCVEDLATTFERHRYRVVEDDARVCVDRWPWSELLPLLAYAGGLLLLVGLLVTHLWGWRVRDVVVRGGERVSIPEGRGWIALAADGSAVRHSPGVRVSRQEVLPGVQIAVTLDSGEPRLLKRAPEDPASTELTLPLTEERLLAVLETPWVIRLAPQAERQEGASPTLVQIYRSPPGQLVTEQVIDGAETLAWEDVRVSLTPVPHRRVSVVYDPGLWPAMVGLGLVIVGLVGSVFWPERRFWLRTEGDVVQVCGPVPGWLLEEGD